MRQVFHTTAFPYGFGTNYSNGCTVSHIISLQTFFEHQESSDSHCFRSNTAFQVGGFQFKNVKKVKLTKRVSSGPDRTKHGTYYN